MPAETQKAFRVAAETVTKLKHPPIQEVLSIDLKARERRRGQTTEYLI